MTPLHYWRNMDICPGKKYKQFFSRRQLHFLNFNERTAFQSINGYLFVIIIIEIILWWNQLPSSRRESWKREPSSSPASNQIVTEADWLRAGEDQEVVFDEYRHWQSHEKKIQRKQEDAQDWIWIWQHHQILLAKRPQEIRSSQCSWPRRPPHEQQNLLRWDRSQCQLKGTILVTQKRAEIVKRAQQIRVKLTNSRGKVRTEEKKQEAWCHSI